MQDSRLASMQIRKRITHGGADLYDLIFRKDTHAFHTLTKVFSIDEIHDQVLTLPREHKMIRDAWQIWVSQIRKDHCLEPELPRVFFCCEKVFFNCHFHAKGFIHGAINRSHSSLAEILLNPIALMQQYVVFENHQILI